MELVRATDRPVALEWPRWLRQTWEVADRLGESVALTSVTFVVFYLGLYVVLPALTARGVPWFVGFAAVNFAWNAALVAAALAARRVAAVGMLDQAPLHGLARWAAVAAVLMAAILWMVAVAPVTAVLVDLRPAALSGLSSAAGWGVSAPVGAALWVAVLGANVAAEETWWRWFILRRQVLTFGRRAWLANGLCWGLGHLVVFPWAVFSILPLTLGVPLLTQRSGRLLSGAAAHLAYDGLGILVVIQLFATR